MLLGQNFLIAIARINIGNNFSYIFRNKSNENEVHKVPLIRNKQN